MARAFSPWSKEDFGASAKAFKKYPPGGSNRWDAIALYVNNLCRQPDPRTKEDCIEKYNQIASSAAPPSSNTAPAASSSGTSSSSAAAAGGGGESKNANATTEEEGWSEEQDSLLQEMLRKYPAEMEKNEQWKQIAKGVPGRTKKECVQRFKAIREALRQGKN